MECPILVVAEHFDEKLSSVTLPLIMQGRHLADRNASELGIVVLGSGLESLLEELATTGADRVYFVDEPELKHYNPEIYTEVMHQVLTTVLPQIVLLGYTFVGMELGPAIAVRTGLKLLSNCTGVELTNQSLVITRPLYRGAVNVKIEFDPRTRLILSLQESELPRQPATQRKAVLQKMPASVGNSRTEVVGFVRP